MIFISCVFKTTVHRYNISSYKKEQLKLHRSHLGVKGKGITALSLQHLAVKVKINILGQIFVKSATNSTNNLILYPTYNKYIDHFFSKTLWAGAENNPVRSSISD